MNTRKHNRSGGFTLIELLVVILIICLLAGILVPSALRIYAQYQTNITRMSVATIDGGVQAYRADFGDFPPSWVKDPDDTNTNAWGYTNQAPGSQLIYEYLTGYCHDLGINPGDPPDGIPFLKSGDNPNDTHREKRFILAQKAPFTMVDNTDDGAEGWGFRATPHGPVHGPYNDTKDLPAKIYSVYTTNFYVSPIPPPLYPPRPVFVDVKNFPILYYRYRFCRPETGDYTQTVTSQYVNGYDYFDNYKSEMVKYSGNPNHGNVQTEDPGWWDNYQQGPHGSNPSGYSVAPTMVADPVNSDSRYLGLNAYASNLKNYSGGGTYPYFRTDYIIISRGLNGRWDAPSPPPQSGVTVPPSDDVTNFYNQ